MQEEKNGSIPPPAVAVTKVKAVPGRAEAEPPPHGKRGAAIVLKDKKRRYSRETRELQRSMRGATRMMDRVVSAVSRGLEEYRKRADVSSRKKRDGMLKDFVENYARGMGKMIRVSSKLPSDATKMVSRKWIRRQIRGVIRGFGMR